MTDRAHTLDAGQAPGTAITGGVGGNSAVGGDFFDTVTGSPTYTSSAYRGSSAAQFATTASASHSLNWTSQLGSTFATTYGRVILKPTSLSAVQLFFRARAATVQSFRVVLGTDGKITIRNTISGVVVTSSNAMTTANTWLIRWAVTVGASSVCTLFVHTDPTSGTPTETLNGSAANFGTGNIDEVNFGIAAGTINAGFILDDVAFSSIAAPGPPAQFLTVSDTITITDTTVRAVAAARNLADTTTITDSAARAFAAARTAADSSTITDAAVRALATGRSAADTTTITDGAARGLIVVRAASTSTSITDGAARTTTAARAQADTITVTDTAALAAGKVRSTSDTITIGDTADRTMAVGRSAADTLTISDAAAASTSVSRSASATTTILDAAIRTLAATRTVDDVIAIADTAERNTASARTAAETIDIDDSTTAVFVPGGAHAPGRGTPGLKPGSQTALLERPASRIRSRNGASLI